MRKIKYLAFTLLFIAGCAGAEKVSQPAGQVVDFFRQFFPETTPIGGGLLLLSAALKGITTASIKKTQEKEKSNG